MLIYVLSAKSQYVVISIMLPSALQIGYVLQLGILEIVEP